MSTALLVEEAGDQAQCFRSFSSSSVRSRLDSLDLEDADLLLSQWGQRLFDEALLAKEKAEGLSALSLPAEPLRSPPRPCDADTRPFRATLTEESPSRDDRRSCTSLFQLQTAAEVLGLWRPNRQQAQRSAPTARGCCQGSTAASDELDLEDDDHCLLQKSRMRSMTSASTASSRRASDSKPIRGLLTLRGVVEESSRPISLASALPQALRTLLKPCGGVSVKLERTGPESNASEYLAFEFEVTVDDDNDRPIAKEILTIEGALGGAKQLLPSLAEASVGNLGRLSLRLELTPSSN